MKMGNGRRLKASTMMMSEQIDCGYGVTNVEAFSLINNLTTFDLR